MVLYVWFRLTWHCGSGVDPSVMVPVTDPGSGHYNTVEVFECTILYKLFLNVNLTIAHLNINGMCIMSLNVYL